MARTKQIVRVSHSALHRQREDYFAEHRLTNARIKLCLAKLGIAVRARATKNELLVAFKSRPPDAPPVLRFG